jgi:predicted CXXCH cytochrome family protein
MKKSVLDRGATARFRKRSWISNLSVLTLLVVLNVLGGRVSAQASKNGDQKTVTQPVQNNSYVGNQVCAQCHASIFESYGRTAMAHASGPAAENLQPTSFVHPKSGVRYRIYSEDGKTWLGFERPGDPAVNGKRELLYFIGSGHRGRTYLFSVDGFFFESPINWYADRKVWDMAPAYGNAREIPLNLPAYTACLQCHTSGMQQPVDGTENKYPTPLFTQNGVGCERCHGPGSAHANDAAQSNGSSILNPVKLPAAQRDSICMQCHLEANVAIARPGHHAYDFRPGAVLDDYVRHFVLAGNQTSGVGANSQFEALAQSKCKIRSGNSMSCMSCHDPHSSPVPDQRASYFREKCLACHGAAFGAKHHTENTDCTSCHMPSSLSTDIAHTEVTDHRIRVRPQISAQLLQDPVATKAALSLVPFPYSKEAASDIRDQALAWQSLANGGVADAAPYAEQSLRLAAKQSPDDPEILAGLAFIELSHGQLDGARALYEQALASDPNLVDAAANLGVIEARSGHFSQAVKLWEAAFERAPGKSSIGMNLARTLCEAGQMKEAKSYVERVLRFNPDLSEGKKLLQQTDAALPKCTP